MSIKGKSVTFFTNTSRALYLYLLQSDAITNVSEFVDFFKGLSKSERNGMIQEADLAIGGAAS